MFAFAILSFCVIILARILNDSIRSTDNVEYHGKFYFLKITFIYSTMIVRKFLNKLMEFKRRKNQSSGYGLKSRSSPEEMDMKQPLSNHPKAIDAVYFNLASKDGWHLITGTAHRPQNTVNGFLCLKVPDVGILETPKLPDTMLFRTSSDREDSYGAEGIVLCPFQAMRTWRIHYSGKMHFHDDRQKTVDVTINGVWNSALPYFDFDTDMNPYSISQSIANEPWSKEYFQNLKEFHQTHYEQHGDVYLRISVNEDMFDVKLNGVRDHSYAYKREWKLFHRYALHFITLENGMRISVGIVCTPIIFSRLVIGYVYLPSGEVINVNSCTLHLSQHGQNGLPPADYGFCFQAGNVSYEVLVNSSEKTEFYIGWEWESKIVEQFAEFTVNGVRGWGAVEWQYRNIKGRPSHYSITDPSWTKNIKIESIH